jgi:Fic family protein
MQITDFSDQSSGRVVSIGGQGIAYVPNPLPPEIDLEFETQQLHESAVLALGQLRAIVPTLPNAKLISSPFLHREAVLSSRIEGIHTEMDQLYFMETTDSAGGRGESNETNLREVLNYVRAIEYGVAKLSDLPVCQRLIKELHSILMQGVRGDQHSPGSYRSRQNFIGRNRDIATARYVPPPPTEMNDAMHRLESYIHGGTGFPSLIRIALIHYQFEAIHPFEDGNGRIGRLLITLLLNAYGLLVEPLLYLSAFFERERPAYYDCLLRVSLKGAWQEWIRFFLQGILTESRDASLRARRLIQLREDWRNRIQQSGATASVLTLVDALFKDPVVTVSGVQQLLNMTYRGAKLNVDKLEEAGILTEVTGQRRNKVYLAKPITDLLAVDQILSRDEAS